MVSKITKTTKGNIKKTTNKKVDALTVPNKTNSSASSLAASSPQLAPVPENAINITTAEQKKMQDMIMHAQLEFAKIKTQVVREKKREIDALNFIIKEFMGPFILIGYDLNNNPIEMISANSTAEHDAILERLRRVMYKISQNIASSNGNDPYGILGN